MTTKLPTPTKDALTILPLGGCGQFGANVTLYGYDGQWIMVDCGMGFADERLPGVDVLLPDVASIAGDKDRLQGLIVTHAHEDHLGGVAWMWPQLKCPIYTAPFSALLLEKKFEEHVYAKEQPKVHQVDAGQTITLGHFRVTFVRVAHSIPHTRMLVIETPIGRVVHTGDWTMDAHPVSGELTDDALLKATGQAGVLAYVGDSTNATVPGKDLSEEDVEHGLTQVFKSCPRRIAVTMFASNVGRVLSVYRAARACGRQVALVGRSLDTMVEIGRRTGHISDDVVFVDDRKALELKDHEVVFIVTGSQGEGRAALSRIARLSHPVVRLRDGDTVVFSSRAIPGNESAISEIKNLLLMHGVRIVTDRDAKIHVSGHPARDEITTLLSWLKPAVAIPVHGERMQLEAHAQLARDNGVQVVQAGENGALMLLTPDGKLRVDRHIPITMQAVELGRVQPVDTMTILERRKMSFNGLILISVVLSEDSGEVLDVQITAPGVLDASREEDERIAAELEDYIGELIEKGGPDLIENETRLIETIRGKARRFIADIYDVKPLTVVHTSYV